MELITFSAAAYTKGIKTRPRNSFTGQRGSNGNIMEVYKSKVVLRGASSVGLSCGSIIVIGHPGVARALGRKAEMTHLENNLKIIILRKKIWEMAANIFKKIYSIIIKKSGK